MRKRWCGTLAVGALFALAAGYLWGIYLPGKRADEIVRGLVSGDEKERIRAMEVLDKTRRLGARSKTVADKLRTKLSEANGDELCPLIITVANCGHRGTGVDLVSDPADQKLVLDAVQRYNRHAAEKGYTPFDATIGPDGKCYVLPGPTRTTDAVYYDADGKRVIRAPDPKPSPRQ